MTMSGATGNCCGWADHWLPLTNTNSDAGGHQNSQAVIGVCWRSLGCGSDIESAGGHRNQPAVIGIRRRGHQNSPARSSELAGGHRNSLAVIGMWRWLLNLPAVIGISRRSSELAGGHRNSPAVIGTRRRSLEFGGHRNSPAVIGICRRSSGFADDDEHNNKHGETAEICNSV